MIIKDLFSLSFFKKLKKINSSKRMRKEKRDEHENALMQLSNEFGVDFGGYIPNAKKLGIDPACCNGYEASYPMPEIFELLKIQAGDRILDVGSGKGYAMFMFSQFPFSQIHGVELSEELVKISKANIQKIFSEDNRFQIFLGNALDFEYLDNYNYIYMYNPFPREIIPQFVNKLKQSLLNNPRKLIVIYQNPQRGALFEESGVFKTITLKDGTAVFESIV